VKGRYEVSVEGHFSSAHALRGYAGKCERLHGHNWRVRVAVTGERLDGTGLLLDFAHLKQLLARVLAELDHCHLNEDVAHFRRHNPSTEEIARYVAERVAPELPEGCRLAWVAVAETPGAEARFIPAD